MAPDVKPRSLCERLHLDGLLLHESMVYNHIMVTTDAARKLRYRDEKCGRETAEAATELFLELLRRIRRPKEITNERRRGFTSNPYEEACHDLLNKFKPIGIGEPDTNGMVEIVNKAIPHVSKREMIRNGESM